MSTTVMFELPPTTTPAVPHQMNIHATIPCHVCATGRIWAESANLTPRLGSPVIQVELVLLTTCGHEASLTDGPVLWRAMTQPA